MRITVWYTGLLLLLISCGGSGQESEQDTAEEQLGAAGGELTSTDGVLTLEVPEGALTETTELSIQKVAEPPAGATGPIYELGPAGTEFEKPVRLAFEMPPGESSAISRWQGQQWEPLPFEGEDRSIGLTTHLSSYGSAEVLRVVRPAGTCDPEQEIWRRDCRDPEEPVDWCIDLIGEPPIVWSCLRCPDGYVKFDEHSPNNCEDCSGGTTPMLECERSETCGDGTCDEDEDCESCPSDCTSCPCGDGTCDPSETEASCPEDCAGCTDDSDCGLQQYCDGAGDCVACTKECDPLTDADPCDGAGSCLEYGNGCAECLQE